MSVRTTSRRLLAAGLATAAFGSVGIVAASSADAVTGPGWRRVWTSPWSYCTTVQGQYAAKGYLTTGCTYYGTASSQGAYFDYHR